MITTLLIAPAGFVDNLELAVAMITDVVNGTFKVRQLSRGIGLPLVYSTAMKCDLIQGRGP